MNYFFMFSTLAVVYSLTVDSRDNIYIYVLVSLAIAKLPLLAILNIIYMQN